MLDTNQFYLKMVCYMSPGNELYLNDRYINLIKSFFKKEGRQIKNFELVSRLCWKNIVIKVELDNSEILSVKFILNSCSPRRRLISERYFGYLVLYAPNMIRVVNCAQVVMCEEDFLYAMVIRNWIEGISYMDFLKTDFNLFKTDCLPTIIEVCNKLWGTENTIAEHLNCTSIIERHGFSVEDVFGIYKSNPLLQQTLYEKYCLHYPHNEKRCLINSDFSLHEFIFDENNQLNIIDWEDTCIGNPIIDIAGIFYSIFHQIASVLDYESVLAFSRYYLMAFKLENLDDFIFYFIERFVMADYLTKSDDERLLTTAILLIEDLEKTFGR